jgi:formate-dependent nitrite reductase cytochrome c552 subunit
MVRYTDNPTVNKRLVAGYYLFLCLVGFAILLGPTGSGIPITIVGDDGRYQHELATPTAGATSDTCMSCHSDNYNYWNHTSHANDLMFNGTHVELGHGWRDLASFNSSCAWCHATGTDNETWWEVGVGCMACHDATSPYLEYNGDSCGNCHNPEHHETATAYPDWEASAHANSLTDLRTSDHASSDCMHCMSTEGFINQQNPGSLASTVDTGFDVNGDYTSISCPACHAVHSNWSMVEGNVQLRATSATDLCSLCHNSVRHPQYQVWFGGPHDLAGVECTDCHGYQLIYATHGGWTEVTNHTFAIVNETATCGQTGCHEGELADWAINMKDSRAEAYTALTDEITSAAASLAGLVDTYNATAGANYSLSAEVYDSIDAANSVVSLYNADKSMGMHNGVQTFDDLNAAYANLLNAKAMFFKLSTTAAPAGGMDMIIVIGGAAGGLVLGLVLGVLVGRRR